MNDRNAELIRRIEELERSKRRLTRWGALGALALAGAGLTSMRAVCDTVTAERFVLVDPAGKQRATLTAYETGGAPELTLFDAKGRAVARLATDDGGAYLSLSDAKGERSARFTACTDGAGAAHATGAPAGSKREGGRTPPGATLVDATR